MLEPAEELARLRARIERLDARMLALLAERCRTVARIAECKRDQQLPAISLTREAQLRAQWHRWGRAQGLDEASINALFAAVCRRGLPENGV